MDFDKQMKSWVFDTKYGGVTWFLWEEVSVVKKIKEEHGICVNYEMRLLTFDKIEKWSDKLWDKGWWLMIK